MIQTIINRLANNSFQFKGWFITLIVAINIFDLTKPSLNKKLIIILITIIFLIFDMYYLYLEKLYRKLYVAALLGQVEDFDMNIERFKNKRLYFKTLCSVSAYPYYFTLLFITLYIIYNHFQIYFRITWN